MKIIAQIAANNEIRLTKQSDDYIRSDFGDSASIRRESSYAGRIAERERLSVLLSSSQPQVIGSAKACPVPAAYQIQTDGKRIPVGDPKETSEPIVENYISIFDDHSGTVRRLSAYEAVAERRSLDILNESHREAKRVKFRGGGWGNLSRETQFTRLAKKRILCAGAIVERKYRKCSTRVLTTTIPGSGKDIYEAVAKYSGWLLDLQNKSARRAAKGEDFEIFMVWELQKRGALHQHWCVASSKQYVSQKIAMALRDAWYRGLDEIGAREGINLYLNTYTGKDHAIDRRNLQSPIQRLKKSVAGYFGKYASKSASKWSKNGDYKQKVYCPSRWWSLSASLRTAIKDFEIKFEFPFLSEKKADEIKSEFISLLESVSINLACQSSFELVLGNFVLKSESDIFYVSHEDLLQLSVAFMNRLTLIINNKHIVGVRKMSARVRQYLSKDNSAYANEMRSPHSY